MSRITCLSAVLLVAISFVGAQDVRYNFDKTENFSKFKTYKWVLIKGAQTPNDIVDKQVKSSIDAQLAAKGLSKVDSDQADIFLAVPLTDKPPHLWCEHDPVIYLSPSKK